MPLLISFADDVFHFRLFTPRASYADADYADMPLRFAVSLHMTLFRYAAITPPP